MKYGLMAFGAALASCLLSLSASAATTSKNVDITVTHSAAGTCSCGAGGTPNICPDNPTPASGSLINVTLACGGAGNYIAFFLNNYVNNLNQIATGGVANGTFQMTVPAMASDRPAPYKLQLLANSDASGYSAYGQSVTVPATFAQVFAADKLPASVGADPFVPDHIMAVCPSSSCAFQHPQNAIDTATNNHWDNVLITIEAADYPFDNLGVVGHPDNHIYIQGWNGAPPHLWIKGIIGSSGTDGTVFPTIHGVSSTGGDPLGANGNPEQVTIDNLEFSNFDGWTAVMTNSSTTLRNVYIWGSSQGFISDDSLHHDLYIYNSHFARNGGHNHGIYVGNGDTTDVFVLQNSVIEQNHSGHDVKSRASSTTLICDKLLMVQDTVYEGSEMLDCSEGRICKVRGVQFLSGAADRHWSDNQSFDALRFGADREFVTMPNNYIDMQDSVLIEDKDGYFRFLNLFKPMTPTPPYKILNNKFVFSSSAAMLSNNSPFVPNVTETVDSYTSAIVYGNGLYKDASGVAANAANVDLGTIGTTNFIYPDRATAGLSPRGSYPKSYNDPAFSGTTPASCTDPIGLVKVPPS